VRAAHAQATHQLGGCPTRLLRAYTDLRTLIVRGNETLIEPLLHMGLHRLVLQSSALHVQTIRTLTSRL